MRRVHDLLASGSGYETRRAGRFWGAAAAFFVASVSGAASGNGRYPLANQLVIEPGNPAHMAVRATFGLLDSHDGGLTWRWICEDAFGASGNEDPAIALTAGGTELVAFSRGLRASHDDGCSWSRPAGRDGHFGVDVTAFLTLPGRALALESTRQDGAYVAILASTSDDGETWTDVGAPMPRDFLPETVEVAPSRPTRVYVSGRIVGSQRNTLERSDDGGETFTRTLLDLPGTDSVYIGAVDPIDADVVYMRTRSTVESTSRALVTRDAGATWAEIWSGPGELAGFALSGDGATVALGGPAAGVHAASTRDFAFHKTSEAAVSCLTFRGDVLFACAKDAIDGFSIGSSVDLGAHFAPVLRLPDLAPRACALESAAGICASVWPSIADVIGADAGAADASEAGPGATPEPRDSSCGCRIGAQREAFGAGAWLAVAALFGARASRSGRSERRGQRGRAPSATRR